jgi:hypothetical protein
VPGKSENPEQYLNTKYHPNPVGVSLLAIALDQPMTMLTEMTGSRAGSLLQIHDLG